MHKIDTDNAKTMLNSLYGVNSVQLSTAGYNPDSMKEALAKIRKVVVDSPFAPNIIVAPKEWTGVGYNPDSISKDTLRKISKVTKNSIYGVTLGEPIKPYDLPKKDDFKDLSLAVHKVQFNEKKGITTIVWEDGEITMAKCNADDIFDRKIGVLICLAKRFFNNNTQFNTWLNEVTEEPEVETKSLLDHIIENVVNKYQPKHAK